jgi:hypothetical protein
MYKLIFNNHSTTLDYQCINFYDFYTDRKFDLVLCEAILPLQLNPTELLKYLSSFVKPGGIIVCTCIDPISYTPDLIRRAICQALIVDNNILDEQLLILSKFLKPHFAFLKNMSRPLDDWILDNVLQPYCGRLMSMYDAITALTDDFDVYGSSPHYFNDWRWYKDINKSSTNFNDIAINLWKKNVHNMLDFSVIIEDRKWSENKSLYDNANKFTEICFSFYDNRDFKLLKQMSNLVLKMANNIGDSSSKTKLVKSKLINAALALDSTSKGDKNPNFGNFISMFGRTQQYLSFIKIKTF